MTHSQKTILPAKDTSDPAVSYSMISSSHARIPWAYKGKAGLVGKGLQGREVRAGGDGVDVCQLEYSDSP